MYLTAVLQTIILNHNPVHLNIKTDEETWEQSNIMFVACNGPREGGGFMVAPKAVNTDGIFHYAIIGNCSRLTMFRLVPEVMKGTHDRFKQVKMGSFKKLSLTSDKPLYIHVDGEIYTSFGSNLHKIELEMLPNALKVVRGE